MRILNLGILAHVDAGKTSLTERLLYAAGVICDVGKVDEGSTQTDFLALERQRGITIKSAVVSFVVNDVTVNLIDTPGHPDFIAEVERVLGVLDAVVLVVSAVEGVQPQTRVLFRALKRLNIPTVIFVNKIDRRGARYDDLVSEIAAKLGGSPLVMGAVTGLGEVGACFESYTEDDPKHVERLTETLAERSEALLHNFVSGEAAVSYAALFGELAAQTRSGVVQPVFFGSAVTGAGVSDLMDGIASILPSDTSTSQRELAGKVFKITRGAREDRLAHVRLFSGELALRDRLTINGKQQTVTSISAFTNGRLQRTNSLSGGQIGVVGGLHFVRVGDFIGSGPEKEVMTNFPPPTLEAVVAPRSRKDGGRLQKALIRMADEDPLINVRYDEWRREISVSLYGEVQKEVIETTLADEYDLAVVFESTTTVCIERVNGTGSAVEINDKAPNPLHPFLASVGLLIEPGETESGVQFRLAKEVLGTMPAALFRGVEEAVHGTLRQGLCGWAVTDCVVTMTHSGYWPRQSHAHGTFDKSMSSTAGDFRNLTPLLLMEALSEAGTTVCEPFHRFLLEVPPESIGTVVPLLAHYGGLPGAPTMHAGNYRISGEIPVGSIYRFQQQLPEITNGEGVFESIFSRYSPVSGVPPVRVRTDNNPLNKDDYLAQVARR